jgi:adenylate kinase family enzyme
VKRVLVLGNAGTGKSVFSEKLGAAIGAPVIHLDALWPRALTPEDMPAFRALVTEAHAGEAWVSDGNFAAATFDLRAPRADLVIWLERPRWLCAWRAAMRALSGDATHKLRDLPRVLRFIWGFEQRNKPLIEGQLARHAAGVARRVLRSDAESAAFLAAL